MKLLPKQYTSLINYRQGCYFSKKEKIFLRSNPIYIDIYVCLYKAEAILKSCYVHVFAHIQTVKFKNWLRTDL